jgi:hypothetical protein
VESVNIVGYLSQTLTAKSTMVGLNFGAVGDGGADPNVDRVPKGQEGLNAGATATTGDNIQVLGESGYTVYFLCNGNTGKGGAYNPDHDGWRKAGDTGGVTADAISAGGAFWFISQSAASASPVTLTLAGQVATDATLTKSIPPGLNMIANGYAVDLAFADPASGLSIGTDGATATTADNIQVLADGAYTVYFFCNGNTGKGGAYNPDHDGWRKAGDTGGVTTETIPAGASAWYINRGAAFDWANTRPYSL